MYKNQEFTISIINILSFVNLLRIICLMTVVGASIYKNQQFPKEKMYLIVETYQVRIIRTNSSFSVKIV